MVFHVGTLTKPHGCWMNSTKKNFVDGSDNYIRRDSCYVGENVQGIHNYNEYGQLMRVQALLNTVMKSEQSLSHTNEDQSL